jgi:hypothetical protein
MVFIWAGLMVAGSVFAQTPAIQLSDNGLVEVTDIEPILVSALNNPPVCRTVNNTLMKVFRH